MYSDKMPVFIQEPGSESGHMNFRDLKQPFANEQDAWVALFSAEGCSIEALNLPASDKEYIANFLWDAFSDVPINSEDEIEESFLHFGEEESRFTVLQWFETTFDISASNWA